MADEIRVGGTAVPPADADFAELYAADFADYAVRREVAVLGAGRGTSASEVILDGAGDDVVEVRDLDGTVRFQRAASLAEDLRLGAPQARLARDLDGGSADVGSIRRVRAQPPAPVAEALGTLDDLLPWIDKEPLDRSVASMAVNLLAPVVIDPAARAAAIKVAEWIEKPARDEEPDEIRRRKPKIPGLYQVGADLLLEARRRMGEDSRAVDTDRPLLLLLHGTFSHTEAAFKGLRGKPEWTALTQHYGDRLLALEHPTLSSSPVANALVAAKALPDGAVLHLVSHSRGGLVGDLIALAAAQDPAVEHFPAEDPDRAALQELRAQLRDRRIVVAKFARVASPSAGTTLASRRLDAWASVLFNVAKLVPMLNETGIAELIRKFVLAFLEQRSDPRVMPGVEAMMPESACVRLLNTAPVLHAADGLASLTGDIDGKNLLKKAMIGAVDLFYGGANDLVVDTPSMTRGLRRPDMRAAAFKGPEVNHGAYFANADSRTAVRDWLLADSVDVPPFASPQKDAGGARGSTQARRATRDAIVLFIPDALGCTITRGTSELWPDVPGLAQLGPDQVLVPGGSGQISELVPAYSGLVDALAGLGEVRAVLWDARAPWASAVEAVGAALSRALSDSSQLHVVAHGTGALLVEEARDADRGASWELLRAGGGRCVLLSPPAGGSGAIVAMREGHDSLSAFLSLLRADDTPKALGAALSELPGIAASRSGLFADRPATWWDGVTAVHGAPAPTPATGSGGELVLRTDGDGSVLYEAARLPGLRTRYATATTWDLLSVPGAAEPLAGLLDDRPTPELQYTPPGAAAPERPWPIQAGRLPFPDTSDLIRAALRGPVFPPPQRPQLRIEVSHGDLRHLRVPLILGSFDGTPIGGAERVLDRQFAHALSRRQALGQHAGPTGSLAMYTRKGRSAAVIGMGDPGDITPARLSAGITQAVLRLGADRLDTVPDPEGPFEIATVLIGTSEVAAMNVTSSLTAIVNGVRRANRRLRGLSRPTAVTALTVVEIYEGRAAEAAHALDALLSGVNPRERTDPLEDVLVGEPIVQGGRDGLDGEPRREDREAEWRTIRVGSAAGSGDVGALVFTGSGSRAGLEQQVSTTQRRLVDRLIATAIATPRVDPQLYNTLYELLLPPSMKGSGREQDHIMYVVDKGAAVLPLELLGTRAYDGTIQPIATDVGVVRRLETRTSRPNQRIAAGAQALVVGNPPTTRFRPLPGAAREARQVAAALRRQGFAVTELIADGPDDPSVDAGAIVNALFGAEHRIVHIAAHGVFDPERPAASGVVIGDDLFLTALEIQRMRAIPELIFLNCCHIGAQGLATLPGEAGPEIVEEEGPWRPDRTAANLSRALIDSGVRAVVAAGWAVDDIAAADFAATFYDRLLGGTDLGGAGLAARSRVHDQYPDTNTWGAYQIYGPPAFRLSAAADSGGPGHMPVNGREFREALARLTDRARGTPDVENVADELQALVDAVPARWIGGEEYELISKVKATLGDYRGAIDAAHTAVRRWGARSRLQAIEQLASLETKAAGAEGLPHAALLKSAEERLKGLVALAEDSPERFSLTGSLWKRKAEFASGHERWEALVRSAEAYRAAFDLDREQEPDKVNYYAGLNHALMSALAARHDKTPPDPTLPTLINCCEKAAETVGGDAFWVRATPADATLVCSVAEAAVAAQETTISDLYSDAFVVSTPYDRRTIDEHLRIVRALLPPGQRADRAALERIRQRLAGWQPAPERPGR